MTTAELSTPLRPLASEDEAGAQDWTISVFTRHADGYPNSRRLGAGNGTRDLSY